jgi:hypothetical protein
MDSAGNILRNAKITVKSDSPTQAHVVAEVFSDDDGSFITPPLPGGTYDIYESGIRVSRQIHCADPNAIQCFKPAAVNHPSGYPQFAGLASSGNLNDFRFALQIESESNNVSVYGNTYPLLNRNILSIPDDLEGLSSFYGFTSDSRVTTTRFDIEYFAPLTNIDKTYKRIRWSGIPAVRFFAESRLVLPLDYYSIVANMPRNIGVFPGVAAIFNNDSSVEISSADADVLAFFAQMTAGDIVKFECSDFKVWYGIYHRKAGAAWQFKWWQSSNYQSDAAGSKTVVSARHYDGMFQTITNINELANERFTAVENIGAQNQSVESYNYNNRGS